MVLCDHWKASQSKLKEMEMKIRNIRTPLRSTKPFVASGKLFHYYF